MSEPTSVLPSIPSLSFVERGKSVVVSGGLTTLRTSGGLEDSTAIIALSGKGIAIWNVAGSDPEDDGNLPGMDGDFARSAVNATLFCVVFGSSAKNFETSITATIEKYLNGLNGRVRILWYKDGTYEAVSVNGQGSITLSTKMAKKKDNNIGPSMNLQGIKIPDMMGNRYTYCLFDTKKEPKEMKHDEKFKGNRGTWRVDQNGKSGNLHTTIEYELDNKEKKEGLTVGLIQIVRAGSDDVWTTPKNNKERPQKLDEEVQIKKTTDKGWRIDGHHTNTPFFNAAPYLSNIATDGTKNEDKDDTKYIPTDRTPSEDFLYDTTDHDTTGRGGKKKEYTGLYDRPKVTYGKHYTVQFLVTAMDWNTGDVFDTLEWGGYGTKKKKVDDEQRFDIQIYAYRPRGVFGKDKRDKELLKQRDDCWKYWNEDYEKNKPKMENWAWEDNGSKIYFKLKQEIIKIPGQGTKWGKE